MKITPVSNGIREVEIKAIIEGHEVQIRNRVRTRSNMVALEKSWKFLVEDNYQLINSNV